MNMDKATLIALGGQELDVTHLDGAAERVLVRLLKIAELPRYFELVENEGLLAAFVCGKDATWPDVLTAESLLDICEAAHDLNFQNARRWAERRARQTEALLPVAETGLRVKQALGTASQTAGSHSEKRQPRLPKV